MRRFDTRFFTADASAIAHRVEGVIHADAELVELVWVELGSKQLADLHPMTKNVLNELEKRLATGPLQPRRAGAVFPFLRRQDAEGHAGGVALARVIPVRCRRSDFASIRTCAAGMTISCAARQNRNNLLVAPDAIARRIPISCRTITKTEWGDGKTSIAARRVHAAGQHSHRRWRYPGAWPDANFNFAHIKQLIRKLEAGKFDAFFMADHLAVLNMPVKALKRSHTVTSFEPFTLLSALAGVTEHIGLIATGSTTFDEPYHVARRFASLDHISGGRAGWNIVTTSNPDAALNFGLDEHMEHAERYKRAREFYDVVTGLWDSFADDAFVRDVESGLYFDPAKMHVLDHKGKYLSVRGPLNIARPVQGWPVIVQAGASEDGRQLAAETAEAVFTGGGSLADGQKFYADIKGRMDKLGRNRDHLKILPGAFVVVGDSVEEAKEKRALLDSMVHYDSAIASLSVQLGTDASGFDPDGPAARDPRNQCQQERPRAPGRSSPRATS